MGVHVYCIAPLHHPVPVDCVGLEERHPVSLPAGTVAVWVTEHDTRAEPSVDAARDHNDVVRAAMTEAVTPVPARFGQWFGTANEAVARVTADAAKWSALLDRFAGRAEYGVRVHRNEPAGERDVHAAPAESGTEYMAALAHKMARAAHRRADADRIAAGIARCIGGLASEQRIEHMPAGELVVTLSHLVAWTDVAAYHGAINEARTASPDARLVVTGPWPPYSFVE